jgi:hypothetical protein
VPAAAVIPAPIAYIKVVAVKKLVVEFWASWRGPPNSEYYVGWPFFWLSSLPLIGWAREPGLLL